MVELAQSEPDTLRRFFIDVSWLLIVVSVL
ncbi:hypothetical protein QFZ80_000129 [Paenibacillus sp. V4I7]|nr:hypothetical protein [Paenibacillus sp. V4I7]MDQ0913771.1 hypothetical protein [Paenibacillus sp. V4I5]